MSKGDKVFLGVFFVVYIVVWYFNYLSLKDIPPKEAFKSLGHRWIVELGGLRINPATLIMSVFVILTIMWLVMSIRKNMRLIPTRGQSFFEWILESFYKIVEDTVPDPRFVRPTFVVATTLFLYIATSNLIGSFPGVSFVGYENGNLEKISLFVDTWQPPTADLNTNLTYALMVFFISHAFAIKAKGFKMWLKGWFEPNPIMFPMNLIGELAKPLSHSLRLFGNIAGGGILVFIFSYLVKYFLLPVFLWGFFGMFVGIIQALVFSILAVAYISAQLT